MIFPKHDLLYSNNNFNKQIKNILKKAKKLLKNNGSLIIINTQNGKIEGIVNKDLAFSTLTSPGSTFKLVTALAGLKKNINNLAFTINCNDKFFLIGQGIKNSRISHYKLNTKVGDYYRCSYIGGHGKLNFYNAIKKSCNHFFFNLGDKITYDYFFSIIKYIGFDKKVFPTLKDETIGIINHESKRTKKVLSYIGDSGGIFITPLQLSLFINYIATNGKIKSINFITKNNAKVISRKIDPDGKFNSIIHHIKKGLIIKVSTGTDFYNKNYFINFAGKTGTSSLVSPNKTSGWFMGFSPFIKPRISFVIYLKDGTGRDAIKLSKMILFEK